MRKRRVKRRDYTRLFVLVAALLVLGVGLAVWKWRSPSATGGSAPLISNENVKEILLLGVDTRPGDVGRSDTALLLLLDGKKFKGTVLSLPRDTRVAVGGNAKDAKASFDKLNSAYAVGNAELAKSTVETLLHTKVPYYVVADIKSFERVVDALGGVDLAVEKKMHYEDPWDADGGLVIDLAPGEQHLDGAKAMQYVRYRDAEGDLGRVHRQQKFLQAMLKKAVSPSTLPRLPQILRELASAVKTNLSVDEQIELAKLLPRVLDNGVDERVLPGKPALWQDTSYWLPDVTASRTWLAEQLNVSWSPELKADTAKLAEQYKASLPAGLADVDGTLVGQPKALAAGDISVRVLNESGITGAAARSADVLKARGFAIADVGNGDTEQRESTVLTVPRGCGKLFADLPFPCAIEESAGGANAVLRIGRDYR